MDDLVGRALGQVAGAQTGHGRQFGVTEPDRQAAGVAQGQNDGYSKGFNDALCLANSYAC